MPTLACPFCSKPMRIDNGLKWHMENIHGQAHDSSESNVPTVGSDAPDEQHARGILKKCVNSQAVYPLEQHGLKAERGDTPPMRKESTGSRSESRPEWEQLEDWVRSQVQRLIQELLEEEVTEFLGRAKSALRSDSDSDTGYRNGYGRARRLTLSSGTIQLRRPRVRDTEEQFESRLLPLFVNRTRKIAELIPELYLHGLSEGDFDLALRGLLGEDAPVSASTVARLKSKWNDELAQWRSRPLDDLEVVYMWVDGVYVKAGLEKEKAAVLVVMAALSDGSKVVVSTVPGYRESTESWSEVLRDIKRRGLSCPRLVVGDGHLGIWGALRNVYPQAAEQTLLEPQDRKRARQASKATTGPGQAHAAYYPLRADSDRG